MRQRIVFAESSTYGHHGVAFDFLRDHNNGRKPFVSGDIRLSACDSVVKIIVYDDAMEGPHHGCRDGIPILCPAFRLFGEFGADHGVLAAGKAVGMHSCDIASDFDYQKVGI